MRRNGLILFDTQLEAVSATDALLTQVFNGGVYDSTPSLTNGVEDTEYGVIITVYGLVGQQFLAMAATNNKDNVIDSTMGFGGPIQHDFTLALNETFAVWSESSARPVPEPSTILLLGSGLLGLMFTGRKVRRQQLVKN